MTKAERLKRLRDIRVAKGKRDFWEYCKLTEPIFYSEDRWHLKKVCKSLQAFYEDRIVRVDGEWKIVEDASYTNEVCQQFYLEMPPRHGKTRTLTKFCEWVLGKENTYKFMYTSYNDENASDTSRFVRDLISKERTDPLEYVFSDFFNESLQQDNKAVSKWALKGQYFNFIAAGKGGSVTGKGCDFLIVDDPVKNARDALNDNESENTWKWFRDTLLSRVEEGGKILINHTRWPREDLIQRLKNKYEKAGEKPYYELVLPAFDGEKMLCDSLLSYQSYLQKKALLDEEIFEANYNQNVITVKGKVFHKFLMYDSMPEDPAWVGAWCDFADEGDDFMALLVCNVFETENGNRAFVRDVMYVQDNVEAYMDDLIDMLNRNEVDIMKVESNNGGKGFAVEVERRLNIIGCPTEVQWEHNSSNKHTRIITNANLVQQMLIYPRDWKERFPEFARHILSYQRTGKNRYDDAPDVITMCAEDLEFGGLLIYG
jgi:predicted phage terminase large subunit-like protein